MDSSFCAWEVSWKKILKNKWFSVWMDLSETISSVYTPAVGTRRAWASWPAGSGGDGVLWVSSMHKWLPIRRGGREGRREEGGSAIFSVVEALGRLEWYIETPARHVLHQWAISKLLVEGRGGGSAAQGAVQDISKFIMVSSNLKCIYKLQCRFKYFCEFLHQKNQEKSFYSSSISIQHLVSCRLSDCCTEIIMILMNHYTKSRRRHSVHSWKWVDSLHGDVMNSDGRHTTLTSNYICTPFGLRLRWLPI